MTTHATARLGLRRTPAHRRVDHVWTLTAPAGVLTPLLAVPDGGTDLVWNLGDDVVDAATGATIDHGSCVVVGPFTTASGMRAEGCVDLLGVRLVPGGLYGLVPVPVAGLHRRVVAAEELGLPLGIGTDRLSGLRPDARPQAAIAALSRPGPYRDDPAVRRLLVAEPVATGRLDVAGMAHHLGVGVRQLERRVRQATGHSPRTLLRLRRLHGAVDHRRRDPHRTWAEIAAEHRFADQAHLTREARTLLGLRPRDLDAATARQGPSSLHDAGLYLDPRAAAWSGRTATVQRTADVNG